MRNVVLNFQILDMKRKQFMNLLTQNHLHIFMIFTNFINFQFKILIKTIIDTLNLFLIFSYNNIQQ